MPRSDLDYALEDEGVCDRIHAGGYCPRWVTVTAFYSALRYVNHYLFPLMVSTDDGDVEVHTLDEYIDTTGNVRKKHLLRIGLLRKKLKESGQASMRIANKYQQLMNTAGAARYGRGLTRGEITRNEADVARQRLADVKGFCAPKISSNSGEANEGRT